MPDASWLSENGPLAPETRERLIAYVQESGRDAESTLDDALNEYLDRQERGRAEAEEFMRTASSPWENAVLSGGRELVEVRDSIPNPEK